MIILIDENTIHNLQTTATYTCHMRPESVRRDSQFQTVVTCNGDTIAQGLAGVKLWKLLLSIVTQDLTKEVTD